MKRTYQPNNRKRAKKHGFFARVENSVIASRRRKGRKEIIKKKPHFNCGFFLVGEYEKNKWCKK